MSLSNCCRGSFGNLAMTVSISRSDFMAGRDNRTGGLSIGACRYCFPPFCSMLR